MTPEERYALILERQGRGMTTREAIIWQIRQAQREALERAVRVASRYTGPGTKNVHPDVSWEDMSDAAQTVSHTTAQGIAWAIRALIDQESKEPGNAE